MREAIHRLEQIKLIVRVPHAGSRVVTLDVKMMQDIYSAREALEGMAARLAARLMPDAEIEALSMLLDQHARISAKPQARPICNARAISISIIALRSPARISWILQNLHGELYQLIRMCRHQSGQCPSRAQTALDQHRQIANAIAQRDEELAELLMRRHISGAWEIVKKILENQND